MRHRATRCSCSREKVLAAIGGCGEEELRDMAAQSEEIEASCQFCDKIYKFSPTEIGGLMKSEN